MANETKLTLAVVFLARGRDGGLAAVNRFFETYQQFEPGLEHKLYILAKGWDQPNEFATLKKISDLNRSVLVELPDDGYDWGAYFRCIDKINENLVCFLNTHSQIRAN
ncbi:MAG: hypothetical protein AABZ31_06685, partial [Bdellovibrionota bacterium]